mmetsp:Transcript_10538/g.17235  ORF Transcript_10538/g.17235 Transcript_10538/m.17235 type:complete len:85 (-) Transcript_10538:201-455(-)
MSALLFRNALIRAAAGLRSSPSTGVRKISTTPIQNGGGHDDHHGPMYQMPLSKTFAAGLVFGGVGLAVALPVIAVQYQMWKFRS